MVFSEQKIISKMKNILLLPLICRPCGDMTDASRATRQMVIENTVSNYFDLRSSIVLTFSIAAYSM